MGRALRPDAQAFDEIKIVTVPRFKTSGLSGDEWLISANIELWRKGKLIHEQHYSNVETAARFLPFVLARAHDDGLAYFGGEADICDQEGCKENATVKLRLKKEYCSGPGCCGQERRYQSGDDYRMFCERHSTRGDCGIEDADANYEIMEGSVEEPKATDVKPASFGGIIQI